MESPPTPSVFPGRKSARALHWFAIGFFAAMALLSASLLLFGFRDPVGAFAMVGGMIAFWFGMGAFAATRLISALSTIRLSDDDLSIEGPFRTVTIPWGHVQTAVQTKDDVRTQKLSLHGGGMVKLRLGLIEDGDELGRLVQARVADPNGQTPAEPASKPSPSEPSPPLPTSATFGPAKGALAGTIFLSGIFVVIVVACLVGIFASPKNAGSLIFAMLVFGSVGATGAYAALQSMARYQLDEFSLQKKSPLAKWNLEWAYVDNAWRRGNGLKTVRFTARGRNYDLDLSTVDRPDDLAAMLAPHLTESRHPWATEPGHIFRNSSEKGMVGLAIGTCVFMAVFYAAMSVSPTANSRGQTSPATFIVLALLMLLLIGALAATVVRRYETTDSGFWVRGLLSKRFIPFPEIVRIVFGTQIANKSKTVFRVMRIEHAAGGISVSSGTEDYVLLEAFILAHVDPSLIRETE